MDPLSHVIVGRAVVAVIDRAPASSRAGGVNLAAVLGALAPDVDCVLMPFGWDIYLRLHQAWTHSVPGACLVGGAAGLLASTVTRERRSLMRLMLVGLAAALSHLLLDILSGAELRLAWPILRGRVGVPLVAMADPWLVALLTSGAIFMWRARRDLARAAMKVLLAAACLFGVKAVFFTQLLRTMAVIPEWKPESPRVIRASWGTWTHWNVFAKDEDALREWEVGATDSSIVTVLTWPVGREEPLVQASRSLNTVRNFLDAHEVAFAVEDHPAGGEVEVRWSDIRYCRQPAPGVRPECALWFGGLYDAKGRALRQLVHVGPWTQVRPPS